MDENETKKGAGDLSDSWLRWSLVRQIVGDDVRIVHLPDPHPVAVRRATGKTLRQLDRVRPSRKPAKPAPKNRAALLARAKKARP